MYFLIQLKVCYAASFGIIPCFPQFQGGNYFITHMYIYIFTHKYYEQKKAIY